MISNDLMGRWYDEKGHEGEDFHDFVDRIGYAQCGYTDRWGVFGLEVGYGPDDGNVPYEYNGLGELRWAANRVCSNIDVFYEFRHGLGDVFSIHCIECDADGENIIREFSKTNTGTAFENALNYISTSKVLRKKCGG